MTSMTDFNYIYKIILIGDSGVGKSNIISRLVGGTFDDDCRTTIGIDFQVKRFTIDDDTIKLQIWDTAGQEKYRSIIRSYYRMCAGVVLVFDVNKRSSFEHLDSWIKEVEDNTDIDQQSKLEILIVGNKIDLDDRKVFPKDIENLRQKYEFKYIETSAEKNINIERAFYELTRGVHKQGLFLHCSKDDQDKNEKNALLNIDANAHPMCCQIL